MKLQFLGSGTAFVSSIENFHSNIVLESDSGKRLMIDCGSDARHSTAALGLNAKDFDAFFISHFHADHAGGLEWVAFTTKFDPSAKKPKLILHQTMRDRLWNQVLSGGLETIEEQLCSLETYFEPYPLEDDNHFSWEGIEFEMVQTIHVFHNGVLIPSFGLFISYKNKKIYITTDTQFLPDHYMPYYKKADLIFHDCEVADYKSCVHPSYADLTSLPCAIKEKMWLYHYSANHLPNPKKDGFLGFVKRGQLFQF